MAVLKLPPPPKKQASDLEWEQWLELLYNTIRGRVTTSGDAASTIPSGSTYHGVTALTAGRQKTIPPATEYLDGETLVVQDESGAAGTHNITLAASSGDSLLGSASISSNYGRRVLVKRGANTWYSV